MELNRKIILPIAYWGSIVYQSVLIQNNSQIQGYVKFIGYPEYKVHASKLPIKLQDHSNLVSFRNIWIRNL